MSQGWFRQKRRNFKLLVLPMNRKLTLWDAKLRKQLKSASMIDFTSVHLAMQIKLSVFEKLNLPQVTQGGLESVPQLNLFTPYFLLLPIPLFRFHERINNRSTWAAWADREPGYVSAEVICWTNIIGFPQSCMISFKWSPQIYKTKRNLSQWLLKSGKRHQQFLCSSRGELQRC